MEPVSTHRTTPRGRLITLLAVIAALAVVKELVELIGKPASPDLPEPDVQVWFGYRFEGVIAKILTIPHLLIYGYSAYGLFRRTQLGWWVASIYLLYMPVSFIMYMIRYYSGAVWEIVFVVVSLPIIALIEVYLYKHKQVFVN